MNDDYSDLFAAGTRIHNLESNVIHLANVPSEPVEQPVSTEMPPEAQRVGLVRLAYLQCRQADDDTATPELKKAKMLLATACGLMSEFQRRQSGKWANQAIANNCFLSQKGFEDAIKSANEMIEEAKYL